MNLNLSDEAIEAEANKLREKLGMDYVFNIDMDNVLCRMPQKVTRFKVRTASLAELDGAEAFMDCESHTLVLSEGVKDGLTSYANRDKFTAAHEIGHYFLGHKGNTKRNPDKSIYLTPTQRIQESQADKFASYFLVPTKLAKGCKSAREISDKFRVSLRAAEIAFERLQSILRQERGERRRPPAAVIDFLKAAEKQGYKVKSDISGFDD